MTENKFAFASEEDDLLIELISKNPVLFDPQIDAYKHGNLRNSIWMNIAEELNKTDVDCKKRWKYIRDSYNRFKRKRKRFGQRIPPKNSKWEFFEKLNFLELVSLEPTETSKADLHLDVSIRATTTTQLEKDDKSQPFKKQNNYQENYSNDLQRTSINTKTGDPYVSEQTQNGYQKDFPNLERASINSKMENGELSFDVSHRIKKQKRQLEEQNEIDEDVITFGNYLKSVFMKLDPRLRIEAKCDIFNVLTKYEMMQMNNKGNTSEVEMSPHSSIDLSPEPNECKTDL